MSDERKAPETPPETTGTRWLPIAEVETLIGKKERNARYWLDRHTIPTKGERPKLFAESAILQALDALGQDHRKAPERPPEATGNDRNAPPQSTGNQGDYIEAEYRVLPEEIEHAITRTGERYIGDIRAVFDQVATLYDQRLAERDATIADLRQAHAGQVAAQQETIAELRRRAEVAEVERDQARERLAAAEAEKVAPASPQPRSEAPTLYAHDDTPIAPAPAGSFWQRVRRAFGGE